MYGNEESTQLSDYLKNENKLYMTREIVITRSSPTRPSPFWLERETFLNEEALCDQFRTITHRK